MTLKTKIFGVIIAFSFFPLIFSFSMFVINNQMGLYDQNNVQRRHISRWLKNEFYPVINRYGFSKLKIPPGMDICIVDSEGVVRFSNILEIPEGSDISQTISEYYKSRHRQSNNSITENFIYNNERWRVFIMYGENMPDFGTRMRFPLERILRIMLFTTIFGIVLGVIFLRVVLKSVNSLSIAVAKIRGGNFDFKLNPKGNDEFSLLTASFDQMRQALKDEQEAKSRFLIAISHDLKTPLTSIKGYIEAINDGMASDSESYKKYLGIISNKTNVLEERISDLISFAAMQKGEMILKAREISLKLFLDNLSVMYKEDCGLMNKKFIYKNTIPDSLKIICDPVLFERALENHFTNSIRYTFDGAEITLNCYMESNMPEGNSCSQQLVWREIPVVEISDNGSGIDEKDIQHVLEPFYKGSNSRREYGMGLGLSISRSIFQIHGWDVFVFSEKGKGTTFKIILGKPGE
ncbi:MAG: HAMP domain-containing histidine kinase [Spirochaetes bacterium]|nr:HAMP domain-containing histidine kinase [Spirochaetota bacterium]